MADQIAQLPSAAIQAAKRLLRKGMTDGIDMATKDEEIKAIVLD